MESPPKPALRVIHGLHAAGFEAYLVGGCVRDRLIDRAVNDWDVATNAVPEAVIDLFPKCIPTGLQHGTVTVVEDHMPIEVTTYRIEVGHTDGRRPDAVHFTRSLKEDLARRDFTVNAMAWDPTKATIVDPFGGQADLAAKVIRAVGAPIERFSEDGLRPMRAIRFAAALKMIIEPATLAAIPETIDTFRRISAERIRVEFEKTLLSSQPGWGLKTLRDVGLLAEFFPSVAKIGEFERMMAAVDAAPARLAIRLAVMIREAEGQIGALKALRFSNKLVKHVLGLHSHRKIMADIKRTPEALRRLAAEVGRELLDDWLLVGQISARKPAAWTALDMALTEAGARDVAYQTQELSISGQDVMRELEIPPSRQVRVILERVLARVWADPNLDTSERLLALLPELAES